MQNNLPEIPQPGQTKSIKLSVMPADGQSLCFSLYLTILSLSSSAVFLALVAWRIYAETTSLVSALAFLLVSFSSVRIKEVVLKLIIDRKMDEVIAGLTKMASLHHHPTKGSLSFEAYSPPSPSLEPDKQIKPEDN